MIMNGLLYRADVVASLACTSLKCGVTDANDGQDAQGRSSELSYPRLAVRSDILFVAISFFLIGLFSLLLSASSVGAQSSILTLDDPHKITRVTIAQNKSTTVQFSRVYKEVLVGNEKIADIVPLTNKSLYILGKSVGTTRLVIVDQQKEMLGVIEVEVSYDVVELNRNIRELIPHSQIRASSVNGKILLSGLSIDSTSITRSIEIAKQFAPETAVTNAISVNSSQQVMLEVRFVEVSRNADRDLGVNWSVVADNLNFIGLTGRAAPLAGALALSSAAASAAAGAGTGGLGAPAAAAVANALTTNLLNPFGGAGAVPSGNIPFGTFLQRVLSRDDITADVLVQALEEKGLARRLAEPNLVALSGDTANFLAGGEFPFPVPQEDGVITIEFKKFGVGLAFTPTVLARGMINLKIEPEVSELDPASGTSVQGTNVPGLIVRRASTTLELRDGQSFAMAGLLQFNNRKLQRQVPWIGSVPVLGALFRSASYQKNETDLVIIVTPRLVKPAVPGEHLVTPLEKSRPTNDVEFFLLGKQERWDTKIRRPDLAAGHNIDLEDGESKYEGGGHGSFK